MTAIPASPFIVEVEERTPICIVHGCGGAVVRHSLGSGQSVDRCVRCFRRYHVTAPANAASDRSRLRRMLDEFVSWRE